MLEKSAIYVFFYIPIVEVNLVSRPQRRLFHHLFIVKSTVVYQFLDDQPIKKGYQPHIQKK